MVDLNHAIDVMRDVYMTRDQRDAYDSLLARIRDLERIEAGIRAAEAEVPRLGRCENHKRAGGCPLHNLHCGWPKCDEYPTDVLPAHPADGEK